METKVKGTITPSDKWKKETIVTASKLDFELGMVNADRLSCKAFVMLAFATALIKSNSESYSPLFICKKAKEFTKEYFKALEEE